MDDALLSLIDAIYDCALDPARWCDTLEKLGDAVGSAAFVMSAISRRDGIGMLVTTRQDPYHARIIGDHFATAETNPLVAAMPRLTPGVPTHRASVYPDDRYFREALWDEAFRPQKLAHSMVACVLRNDDHIVPMGILRQVGQGDFSGRELDTLQAVLPHIQKSMRMKVLEDKAALSSGSLDHLPLGVIATDRRCRVLYLNLSGQRLAAAGDGILVRKGVLRAGRQADTAALEAAVARATALTGATSTALLIPRSNARRPLAALVAPTSPDLCALSARPQRYALVLLNDLDRRPVHPLRHFVAAFGLSPAEAQLAAALLEDKRLEDVAAERGIAQNTVRTQIKAIFAKTDTKRQSELLHLLASIPNVGAAADAPAVKPPPGQYAGQAGEYAATLALPGG